MSECYQTLFIHNDKITPCENFDKRCLSDGISIYEVFRIIDEIPLFLGRHLERLKVSARHTDIELWHTKEEIAGFVNRLCQVNHVNYGNVKIVFNKLNSLNQDGENICVAKNFLVYFVRHNYPTSEQYANGVDTTIYKAVRNNPNAKIINLSLRERTESIKKSQHVYEVILTNDKGNISEGSRSNIFMIKDGKVFTTPVEKVLPGITRDSVIKVCRRLNIPVIEKEINYRDLWQFDAVFLSRTSSKVLPIRRVNSYRFSVNHKTLRAIMQAFDAMIETYLKEHQLQRVFRLNASEK